MIMREFLSLVDLFGAQTLCVHESTKVIMVGEYENFMLKFF